MNSRAILKELINGNPAPLHRLKPAYDLDRLSVDELQALGLHHMGISLLDSTELVRITNKAFMKPLNQMTDAELRRIAGGDPLDVTTLSDEELRKIIQSDESE